MERENLYIQRGIEEGEVGEVECKGWKRERERGRGREGGREGHREGLVIATHLSCVSTSHAVL